MLTNKQKEQTIELRKQNKSYADIAKILNISKDQAKGFSKSKYFKDNYPELVGYIKGQQGDKLTKDNINIRLKERYPNFEYISGYKNCESMIKIRCNSCGEEIVRGAQILRKYRTIECDGCNRIAQDESNKAKEQYKLLKDIKKIEANKIKAEANRIAKEEYIKSITKIKVCKQCGKDYTTIKNSQGFCCVKCNNRYNNSLKDIKRRHRLRANGNIDYTLTLDKLIKRDKSTCKICGYLVDINDYIITNEGYHIAGDMYPSIDHINPVSNGGTHTWSNVQLAHRHCNVIKSNKDIYEKESGQIAFAI